MGIFTGEAKRANILLNFNCNIAMVETAVLVQRQEQNSKGAYNLNIRGASSRSESQLNNCISIVARVSCIETYVQQ